MSGFDYYPLGTGASVKTGTGVSAFSALGSDVTEHAEAGAAISSFSVSGFSSIAAKLGSATTAFTGSGADAIAFGEGGAGISARTASGTTSDTFSKAGVGVLVRTGSGDGRWTLDQRNKSLSFNGLGWTLGMAHVASGSSSGKSVSRFGTAKSIFSARGREGDEVSGTAKSAFVATGERSGSTSHKTGRAEWGVLGFSYTQFNGSSDVTLHRTGFSVRGYAGTGASVVTYVETGAGVSARSANGVSFSPGTAVAPFTGSGDAAIVHAEAGTATVNLSASGHAQPGGVAVVQFTGGGTWANLYANDNFAAREAIDPPTGDIDLDAGGRSYTLAGATGRATTEFGEDVFNTAQYAKTLWWEYTVPFTCIVELDVRAIGQPYLYVQGGAYRGTAVDATAPYADARLHFGEDEGRGMDASTTTLDSMGGFPRPFGSIVPLSIQVDPLTPLVFNVGRLASLGFEMDYRVSLTRVAPPENDGPDTPYVMDPTSGSIAFDTRGATGDRQWDWEQFESLISFPTSHSLAGDLFYSFTPEEDCTFRFRVDDSSTQNLQVLLFEGADIDTWTPMVLRPLAEIQDDGSPYSVYYHPSSFTDVVVEANKTYTLALLQMRFVNTFNGTVFFISPTVRGAGTLDWETVATHPSNDDFDDREDLGNAASGITLVADTRGATGEENEPPELWSEQTKGIWYEYTPPSTGWYRFVTGDYPPVGSPVLDVFLGDDFATLDMMSNNAAFFSLAWLRAGESYKIRLSVADGTTMDQLSIAWDFETAVVAANDDFANRTSISGDSGTEVAILDGATTEYGEPVSYWIDTGSNLPSVWYEWTPPYTGEYLFRLEDMGIFEDDALAVYTGTVLGSLVRVAANSGGDPLEIGFQAQAGVPHQIQVTHNPYFDLPVPATLAWEPISLPTNVTPETAIVLSGTSGEVLGNNFGTDPVLYPDDRLVLFPDTDQFPFDGYRFGRFVWYRYTALVTGEHTFTGHVGNQQMSMTLYTGDAMEDLALLDGDYYAEFGFGSGDLTAYLEADVTYSLLIGSSINSNGDGDFTALLDSEFAIEMMPQGRFSLSWEALNALDDFNDAGDTFSDLGYFQSYFYDATEEGPLYSYPSGGCRVASNVAATAEVGEPAHFPGHAAESSVWFLLRPGAGGTYTFWVEPTGDAPLQDPVMAVYPYTFGTVDTLGPAMAVSDNFDGQYPRLSVALEAYVPYLIAVDGRDQGTFELNFRRVPVPSPPANDDFADAIPITFDSPISGTTVGATVECGETPQAGWFTGPHGSVWYTFTPAEAANAFLQITADAHPEGAPILVDVFQGTTLENLVNITPANTYSNGEEDELFGFPISYQGGTPVYVRFATESDGAYDADGDGGTFSFSLDEQSTTPPGGDDAEDPIDSGEGTTGGSTDGATTSPGEPDPSGGLLEETEPGAGTVWHRYVPDAPGFVDIYTTRDGLDQLHWYKVGVWEGASAAASIQVSALENDPSQGFPSFLYGGATACHFEVRAEQTYWIQVIRRGDQSWGEYDLHIDEYLERNDWALGTDGFTGTTNSPSVSGDTITCTGSQAISDVLQVLPQYGTIDLGADTPKWGRETRIYFEVRVSGQVLNRQHNYGGDDWTFANAASDDHVSLTMRRLGLFRARDTDGAQRLVASLGPGGSGTNYIEATTASSACTSQVSLGSAGPQHDQGWVAVEMVVNASNTQRNDGATDPVWSVRMIVDGRPVNDGATYTGKQLRYIDFGMFRHPSMILANDQYYVENNEAWTYEMRRVRVTNVVPRQPYGVEFAGDLGVFEFDGFASGVGWLSADRHSSSAGGGLVGAVAEMPDKPGRNGFHTTYPGAGLQRSVTYGLSTGSRRIYGFTIDVVGLPATGSLVIAAYGSSLAVFRLYSDGELTISPYGREFCVAHLTEGAAHFVEVRLDAEVMWDVKCAVSINGQDFGTYSNSYTYAEVAAGAAQQRAMPAAYSAIENLAFGTSAIAQAYDLYFGDLVAGIGDPGETFGPLKTVAVSGASGVLGHYIPDNPAADADHMDLNTSDGGNYMKLHSWMWMEEDPGPLSGATTATSVSLPMPVQAPRYWEAYFTMQKTSPWWEANADTGNDWSPLAGLTRIGDGAVVSASGNPQTKILKLQNFGCSVPVDAVVTGIEVRVHRRASGLINDNIVQLFKNGALTGSNQGQGGAVDWDTDFEVAPYGGPGELWGTTWSPQEVNALGFGVGVQATGPGTAEIDMVTVRVYFADEGGPASVLNVGRGPLLSPTGLYNLWGDDVVVEMDYSGAAVGGISWPTGGWEPGGLANGTASHKWNSLYPLWLWQARGDKRPSLTLTGPPGSSGTATNMRIVRNPLVYPRYAWSEDDGASWTWIHVGEDASEDHIDGDVAVGGPDAIFLDNTAALDRFQSHKGGWASGLNQDRPTASPAYRYMHWYLAYVCGNTAEDVIHATNLWARWRPYSGYPKVASGSTGNFRASIAYNDGGVRFLPRYSIGSGFTQANPALQRWTAPRAPNGEAWTQGVFNELQLRLGHHDTTSTGAFSVHSSQVGAALYATTWELLVPDDPSPPPQPCAQMIDLSMARMVPGAGPPVETGDPEGVDLSDVKYAPGAGEEAGGASGVDLSDVLFLPGGDMVPDEEE